MFHVSYGLVSGHKVQTFLVSNFFSTQLRVDAFSGEKKIQLPNHLRVTKLGLVS